MGNFIRITPFMHVADVAEAVHFFVDVLGFKAWIHRPAYAYVQRETAAVRILKSSESPGEEQPPGTRAFRYYIDVEDVDGLYAELKPKIDALWRGQVHGPINQSYGQREFMVSAPDGDLVVFGQSISDMPTESLQP
jgi:catechol 2,3-dioxygenase-like lactoylglutathione lyase family enzyme